MRQILVDYARARSTQKRGGAENLLPALPLKLQADGDPELIELIALDDALSALSAEDQRLAELVEMRYFGGMTPKEAAGALGLSVHVIRHDLRLAQAWLRRKLSQ